MNSLAAHKKISLLAAYNSVRKYEIVCILVSLLDFTTSDDDDSNSPHRKMWRKSY